jgi:hypothetical protein
MRKRIVRAFSLMLCALMLFSMLAINTSAEKITYSTGANGVSDAYKNSRWYKNLTSIELTGDGVTDTLAVALAHVSYSEGNNTSGFNGTQNGTGNYTEFCRNYGEGSAYAWCAAYVSFALFQSRATTSTSKQTVWRDIYCPRWYQNMKNAGYGHDASSNYTPKTGDLVFFTGGGHIGIVRYCKDGKVYTIEGNTSGGAFDAEGGGVFCKSYDRNYYKFLGFGTPPYKANDKALKVDYSGANPTTGLWIGETDKNLYKTTNLSGNDYTVIPYGTVFEVTKIINKTCYQVKYNGQTGYMVGTGGAPIYQLTSTKAAEPEETQAPVVPNKYAINSDLKKVKEHIGSGISKLTLDGTKIKEVDTFELNAGQKLGIEGFAGFSTAIKEFGYYFDGNAENTVLGSKAKTPNADAKKKAGDKAKLFDIEADTSTLSNGAHTVTYVVKLLNNKTCDLVTLNLNVGGSVDGSESSSETGEGGDGCGSAIAAGFVLPITVFAGAILSKKKKHD